MSRGEDDCREAGPRRSRSPRGGRPEDVRRTRVGRHLLRLFCGVLFISGTIYALLGEDGLADRMRLKREHRSLASDVDARRERIRRLEQVKAGLQGDPMHRERIAREQLGYAKPGEVVFLLPDADSDSDSGSGSDSRSGSNSDPN
ncbi:septum formation initiator family protein [bacterium]|nr:septum formation initiator family protein [bacterium]